MRRCGLLWRNVGGMLWRRWRRLVLIKPRSLSVFGFDSCSSLSISLSLSSALTCFLSFQPHLSLLVSL